MKNKSMRLTVAQFAKMHNINKRTLHYYDQIGLFSPCYKGENNYRYYDYKQSVELENILMLKELNMSIDEIKEYLRHPNGQGFMEIINYKEKELNNEIKKLQHIKNILSRKREQLTICNGIKTDKILVIECDTEYILATSFKFIEYDIDKLFVHLKESWNLEQYRLGCGSFISLEKLQDGDFDEYDGIFTPIKKTSKKDSVIIRPKGKYLCGYMIGDWSRLPDMYKKMFEYARNNNLELTGYAYEIGLNEFAISSMDEYITQITIQIK